MSGRRNWVRQVVAVVTGLAVMLSLHGPAAEAAPAKSPQDEAWSPRKEESVSGTNAPVIPRRTDPTEARSLRATPEVTWPATGTAEVSVPPRTWDAVLSNRPGPAAQAGTLPVSVASTNGETPGRVRVDLLGRRGDTLLLRLARTDGVQKAGPVSLTVDYTGFARAFGGDWNSRLQLVRLPGGTPVATRNDGSGRLSADVFTGQSAGLFGVQAASGGGAGDFKASSLSPSATWQVGGSSGDFNWRYPMDVPPGLGGPAVDLALEYSSGGVDGRTSATNNQPSWVGEGFELNPGGAIERRYASCGSQSEKSGNNGTTATGDLCWATDNATFSLNGKGGELVRDDQTGNWKSRGDDGAKVERLNLPDDKPNGDDDREYWLITSEDGTKYYFGLNRLNGWVAGKAETKSTWTVPVFGNHAGEPCNKSAFADSWCQQAYRWNLDYVVDRHGNTMSLFYETETNNYGRNVTATKVSTYVRAGHVARIEYGQRDGRVYDDPAVARVLFTTAERCIPGTVCTTSQPANYPDTPLDQACESTTNCDNKFNPTFWTRKRLASVTTEVWRGTAFAPVKSWTMRHAFPDPGDGTRAGLWLEGITAAGHVGGTAALPEVNFDGIQLPNRVAGIDGIPVMNWWRVRAVHYGTGGELAVAYSPEECSVASGLPAPDTNGKRCHPAKWTPQGQAERQDWFNKFVVTDVTESDRVSGLEPVVTKVLYLSPPAWRHDEEDGLVEIGRKTWSQWRGYERVRVIKGHSSGTQSVVEHRYFRGMDGDKLATGGVKDVKVTDSTGAQVEDVNVLAGQRREEDTYNGTTLVDRKITDHWISTPRATRVRPWGTTQSFQVEDSAVRQDEALEGGAWRRSSSRNTYDASGALTEVVDWNNLADSTDDTCTRYSYTSNPAVGLKELPLRRQTVSVACDQPWNNSKVIADERAYYDNSTVPGGTPTQANVTKVDELSSFDGAGAPIYQTSFTAAYDAIGRRTQTTDAANRTTTKSFTSETGGPVTSTSTTLPNGHVTTTELEPAWGSEMAITGPDGRRTEAAYDPLGRTSKVWMPGRSRSEAPNTAYDYNLRGDAPGVVVTTTLQSDNSFETSIELTDGLLRPRQKQQPAPGGGRILTDYVYDSRGQVVKENGPYFNDARLGDQVLIPREEELPTQKVTSYDAAGQPSTEAFRSMNAEKWRTVHSHAADRHSVVPPSGEQPVTRITDVEGRLVEQRQYVGSTVTGTYDKTTYTYTPAGKLASVTDPAGNEWTFEYDLRGRKTRESDPDKGITTYTYDETDRLLTSTDARGITLAYDYDVIGRKTAVHEGNLQGTKRAEWVYDTLAKGSPTSATRFVNGQAYRTRFTGYDAGGRPLGTEVTLPASEGALAGTYAVRTTYLPDGQVATTELPGVGGLPAETLRYGYNAQDLPTTLTGASSYVTGTTYTPFGEPETVTMAQTGGKWVRQLYAYETGTRRVSHVFTERETLPQRISSVTFGYDPAGNIKRITDTPSVSTGEPADTQCFSYDHLRRLTAAWTPANNDCVAAPSAAGIGGPAAYWHSWTFDKVGNRTSETRHLAGGDVTSTYEYPAAGQARPHALQKVTTTGPTGSTNKTYSYDAMGNMSDRTNAGVGESLAWDAEGHLEKVSKAGKTTSFVYDADGNRLLRHDNSGTTFYFGTTELLLDQTGTVTGTRYYSHTKRTIAVRTGSKLNWLGCDHHGTPGIVIDADSQAFQRRRTTPYGETRGAVPSGWPGQKGFVGGVEDPSTELVHLGAREYDPSTGRFISVDPVADYQDPQQLNGYGYANNNPVTFSDPDGKFASVVGVILTSILVPIIRRIITQLREQIRYAVRVLREIRSESPRRSGFAALINIIRVAMLIWRIKVLTKTLVTIVKAFHRITIRAAKRAPSGTPARGGHPAANVKKNPTGGSQQLLGRSGARSSPAGGGRQAALGYYGPYKSQNMMMRRGPILPDSTPRLSADQCKNTDNRQRSDFCGNKSYVYIIYYETDCICGEKHEVFKFGMTSQRNPNSRPAEQIADCISKTNAKCHYDWDHASDGSLLAEWLSTEPQGFDYRAGAEAREAELCKGYVYTHGILPKGSEKCSGG